MTVIIDTDLSTSELPPFWKEFEVARAKFHSARSHVEGWFDHHWPADAPRYQRFISTSFLRDLIALDFDGNDHCFSVSKRQNGFSVFAVYPLADHADAGDKRNKARAYEDTMDNHRPGDREAMERLSLCSEAVPDSRTEMWKWVRYFTAAVETIFGKRAPILSHLERLAFIINSETMFRFHSAQNWRGYFWKYHCAIRSYFHPTLEFQDRVQPFSDLLFRVRQGQPILPQEIPQEILGPAAALPSGATPNPNHDARRHQSSSSATRDSASPRSDPNPVAKKWAEQWAKSVGPAVQEAAEACKKAGTRWNLRVLYPNGCTEAFGDMTQLLKPGPNGRQVPCPRLFTYGSCTVSNCNACHHLSRDPSHDQACKFTDWVKKRAASIKHSGKA